ncbi:MAG: OmpA family protein [Pseudomonadota bacterium]
MGVVCTSICDLVRAIPVWVARKWQVRVLDECYMDFRFSQFEILTAAGTLLVCLFFICVFSEVSAIENHLSQEVTAAVDSDELYWSSVEINGQQAVLTGAAPDVPAKNAALQRVQGVFGVTRIDNQIQVIGETGTCQTQLDDYLSRETITFKSGKAEVSEGSYQVMAMLAMILRSCNTIIEIAGHTDDKGDAEINQILSQKRADVVAKHMVRHGVSSTQVRARGYGESQPVADNSTDAGRKANRRIEFRVLGGAV